MGGSGKGNDKNHRRFSKRRDKNNPQWQDSAQTSQGRSDNSRKSHADGGRNSKKTGENLLCGIKFEKKRGSLFERPRWTPPKLPEEAIPIPDCPWCGKPISDISAAISDKNTGIAVHFDCVIARLNEGENLENGDAICYIGGGRFGVVHFNEPPDNKNFKIKKIFEWENKDDRSEWRRSISGHFSVT